MGASFQHAFVVPERCGLSLVQFCNSCMIIVLLKSPVIQQAEYTSMLIHIVDIMEQICALPFPSITHFIIYLLSVDVPKLYTLTADLKTEEGTQLILHVL